MQSFGLVFITGHGKNYNYMQKCIILTIADFTTLLLFSAKQYGKKYVE